MTDMDRDMHLLNLAFAVNELNRDVRILVAQLTERRQARPNAVGGPADDRFRDRGK